MVKNPHILASFEKSSLKEERLTLDKKFALYDGMYTLAKQMGALKNDSSLQDVRIDIEIARILHLHVQKTSR